MDTCGVLHHSPAKRPGCVHRMPLARAVHQKTGEMLRVLPFLLLIIAVAGCGVDDLAFQPPPDGAYELGINQQETPPPAAFQVVSDGTPVPVVLGSQGAWMVVGAIRTTAFEGVEKVQIIAELEDAETGKRYARVKFRRSLVDGLDGFRYLTDIFLIVGKAGGDNEFEWEGRDFVMNLRVEESWGVGLEDAVTVRLQTQH